MDFLKPIAFVVIYIIISLYTIFVITRIIPTTIGSRLERVASFSSLGVEIGVPLGRKVIIVVVA